MNRSTLCAAVAAIALSAPIVSAQDAKPAPAKSAPGKPAMGMEMDKQMAQMQENMKKMQQQMDKIRATTDPKERQKLMDEHTRSMNEGMTMMRGMGRPLIMGGGRGDGGCGLRSPPGCGTCCTSQRTRAPSWPHPAPRRPQR